MTGLSVALVTCAAALVPGLGHALLGLRKRGLAFFLLVATTFGTGLFLAGGLPRLDTAEPYTILATSAAAATGVIGVFARIFASHAVEIPSASAEYGHAYLLTAGIMNLLLILDTLDRAAGRRA